MLHEKAAILNSPKAAERLDTVRNDIYSALADIPRKMENIHRHLDLYYRSPELHCCAAQVFVAIFVVLERIVKELLTNPASKLTHHGSPSLMVISRRLE